MHILVIDDHPLFRDGICTLLETLGDDIRVTGHTSCETALDELARGHDYALILLDLNLPGMDGLTGISRLRDTAPAIPIIIISATENSTRIRTAIHLGAKGYIPKSASSGIILNAIKLVLEGGVYLPATMIQDESEVNCVSTDAGGEALTQRQREVLKYLAQGKSNKEIAQILCMAENTVRVHVATILKSLSVKNRTEAGYTALRLGLITDSD